MVDYSTVEGYAVLLGRYAVVATVIGGGYLLFRKSKHPLPLQNKQVNKSSEARQGGKARKQRNETPQGSSDQINTSRENAEKKKKKKHKPTKSITGDNLQCTAPLHEDSNEDGEQDNEEFARQLQNAKSGVTSASQNKGSSRIKLVKQSRANNTNGAEKSSNDDSLGSSTAGVDGDDDLSAANSPALEATKLRPLRRGDISDMLEAPTARASVLRIIESDNPSRPKKERQPAEPEKKETQKQRQNRKRAELRKAIREEEEKDRLKRLEKQLRSAREAEGRPAKDGRAFMAANALQNNSAWATLLTSSSQKESPNKVPELLDTYEPVNSRVSDWIETGDDKKPHGNWQATMPSEEEQIRLLQEETSWNTVTSKKGKKKAGQGEVGDGKGETGENEQPQVDNNINTSSTKKEKTLIVGDPRIDLTGLQYNGKPADALLNDGEQDFAFNLAQTEDEWEVA